MKAARSHRTVLAELLNAMNLSHARIAQRMGWSTPSTVGHKLRGERPWQEGELLDLCEFAGVSLMWLADQSDDLKIARNAGSVHGAVLLDTLSGEQRACLIALMESMVALPTDALGKADIKIQR